MSRKTKLRPGPWAWTLLILLLTSTELASAQAPIDSSEIFSAKRVVLLMGSRFDFGAYAKTQAAADSAVVFGIAEVERIEALISSWQSSSQTSAVNDAAGLHPVKVDRELLELVRRGLRVSELTEGAFDLTAGGLRGIYRFAGQDTVLPAQEVLAKALEKVDYRGIVVNVDSSTLFLQKPGMRMGFGAIGKGYAANRALQKMRSVVGVTGAVANASGDMATWGHDGHGKPWSIGIADPRRPGRVIGELTLTNMAVVTSGDYEKYFTAAGKRYAHILDPRSALPTLGVRSATVVCSDAELADALATSLFVLGPIEGIALVDRLKNVEALIIDEQGELHQSAGLHLQNLPSPSVIDAHAPFSSAKE